MKNISWLFLLLFIQTTHSQNINDYLFDYDFINIIETKKLQNKLIHSFLINHPIVYDYFDKKNLEIKFIDFDINNIKATKKITLYNLGTKKEKIYELEFLENGKIKSYKDFKDNSNHTYEYIDNLEVRKFSRNGFEHTIDSVFYNDNDKLIKFSHHSRNDFNDSFLKESINYVYDKSGRLVTKYNIKNSSWFKDKVSYSRSISNFFYHKDSIVEKTYTNTKNDASLNNERTVFSDTITIESDFKKIFILNDKNQISDIVHEVKNNDSSKSYLRYHFEFNSNNQIISLKRDDLLI